MGSPRLILIYGPVSGKPVPKQQLMIDGKLTCGYREYARQGGCIIYPCPQKVRLPWEMSMPEGVGVPEFCAKYPDAVVWMIKHGGKPKRRLTAQIKNVRLYYSCCSRNRVDNACTYSLVDTPDRLRRPSCRLLVKGKDPDFWKPVSAKEFDYLLLGRRRDKHQLHFLAHLTRHVRTKRSVLWIGGQKHAGQAGKSHHRIEYTDVLGQEAVRDNISRGRVGLLFTENPLEGFPQSFLEMTMCGVPTVCSLNGPFNPHYFFPENSRRCIKERLIETAEALLSDHDAEACRQTAVEHYSLQKAIERLLAIARGEDVA